MLLIAGHRGFVGQHLTRLLDERKISWIGYDLLDGKDIRNKHDLECCFELNQITEVIHLAARAGVRRSKAYPDEYISTNILGTQNIVDMCDKYQIRTLIFYSSSSVYGNKHQLPVTENNHKNPISLYGITKLAGEYIVNCANCQTIIIRPFTVYGENGRKDAVIYKWIEQIKNNLPITIYGDGKSCRGYVYVKDLVKATIDLLNVCNVYGMHLDVNLGGSEVIYLDDIIKTFYEVLSIPIKIEKMPLPAEDIYQEYTDISYAKSLIGFNPKPKFISNLKEIIRQEFKEFNCKY